MTRVRQGVESTAEFYSLDPVRTAGEFVESGARLIHVVDLNAALHGDLEKNRPAVEAILSTVDGKKCSIQLAGGIRNKARADLLLSRGARRIVLGSLAYRDLDSSLKVLEQYGSDRVILALDYDESGKVRTGGWKEQNNEAVDVALRRFANLGFVIFLLTSVKQDGMLEGPDYGTLSRLRADSDNSIRLVASGGVSSEGDLEKLERLGIDEAVIGKAIYERRISDLKAVFRRFADGRKN